MRLDSENSVFKITIIVLKIRILVF